jgi:hypothetical protein
MGRNYWERWEKSQERACVLVFKEGGNNHQEHCQHALKMKTSLSTGYTRDMKETKDKSE